MGKRKITARDILADLEAGLDDRELMEKFKLTSEGLQSLFNKMLKARVITRAELDSRAPINERTVELGLFICPACGNIEHTEFTRCPKCGHSAPDYMRKEGSGVRFGDERMGGLDDASTSIVESLRSAKKPRKLSRPQPPPSSAPPYREYASTIDPFPNISNIVEYCQKLSIGALASYGVVLFGLILIMLVFPSSGVLTVTQSLIGIFILQLPALVIVLTTFLNLRALSESMKVFSDIADSALRSGSSSSRRNRY
jgi:hypothetical protein